MTRRFSAVVARLGTPTGDGRVLAPGGITNRDLPIPLSWQEKSAQGHDGSIVVGRIETVSYGDGMITATGSMLTEFPQYAQVVEQIEAGVTGPSIDLADNVVATEDDMGRVIISQGVFGGVTLVPIEAFADVSISLDPLPAEPMEKEREDEAYRLYSAELLSFASTAQAQRVAAPVLPPGDWFMKPDLDRLTPLTVSDMGRVFGHIAGWDTEHVGLPGVKPPRSRNGYASFHVAAQTVQDGETLSVGTLVTGPRHADPNLAFRAAAQHYDDVSCAVAKVVAGEDRFGIWVAGWLLPGADPVKVEQFMSTPVSGDWRRVGGALELIAVCSVNVPGFPVPRARTAFSSGVQQSLVRSFGITPQAGGDAHPGVPLLRDSWSGEITYRSAAKAKWAWAQMEG